MSDPRLKSIVERIERLNEERKALGADVRDIFQEAKSAGYIPKAIRKVISRRAMNAADLAEEDAMVAAYEAAAGAAGVAAKMVAAGATLGSAARATGVPKATVASNRGVRESKITYDPETGEVERDAPNVPRDRGAPSATSEVGPAVATIREADLLEADAGRPSPLSDPAAESLAVKPAPPSGRASPCMVTGQGAHPGANSDDLTIPSFLRRAAA